MLSKALAYAPPSAIGRGILTLALLLGFYATLLGIAGALFAIPILFVTALHRVNLPVLFVFGGCWVCASLLVASAFSTQRPTFTPPQRRLTPSEAPAVFDLVQELASRAGTAPPVDIYLDWLPNLAVTETGSMLRGRRVLIIGAPLLFTLSVDELRAGVAHELGHFIGGDTRLAAFNTQTHALFSSVLHTTRRDPFRAGTQHAAIEAGFALAQALGYLLVRGYSRLFLRLTRPISRRQELAADALSVALVSAAAAASALEKAHIVGPLYHAYLQHEVGYALRQGVMPTDLVAGFQRWREQFLPSERGSQFVAAVHATPTDPYDTHPALSDRLARIRRPSDSSAADALLDDRLAITLLPDAEAFDSWLLQITRDRSIEALLVSGMRVQTLRQLPWRQIPSEVYAPAAKEAARRAAERLHALMPEAATLGAMFAAVWRALDSGDATALALRLEPALARLHPKQARERASAICADVLGTLLQGALLERGAVTLESFGEASLTLELGDERFNATDALALLASDREAGRQRFAAWAARFEAATPA
jgi:heat shock protein HtpX